MNKTISETQEFIYNFIPEVKDTSDVDIVLAPSFTSLRVAAEKLEGTNVTLAAQDVFYEEKEAGKTFDVLQREIEEGLNGIGPEDIVVAYEPIWAIGTGKTATSEQAQEAHAYIRKRLNILYGNKADNFCIIYGGSVKPENVDSLMACKDVDGALVGGASLKVDSLIRIVKFRKA